MEGGGRRRTVKILPAGISVVESARCSLPGREIVVQSVDQLQYHYWDPLLFSPQVQLTVIAMTTGS